MDCVHIPVHRNLCRERHSRRCAFKGTNFCQTDLSGDRAFLVGNTLLIQALCRTMPYMQRQNLLYIYTIVVPQQVKKETLSEIISMRKISTSINQQGFTDMLSMPMLVSIL